MRRSLTRTSAAAASLVAVLALSACSGSDDSSGGSGATDGETTAGSTTESEATSPSDDASTDEPSGDSVTGTGYSITVPDGWEDVTALAKQSNAQADIAVAEPQESGKFRMNFNVVTPSPLPAGVSDSDLANQAAQELQSVTKAKVKPIEVDYDFDGAKALGQTSTTTAQGFTVTITQFVLVHDDQIFATTMTYEDSREDEAMDKASDIADSWTWNVS
jgi:hypothetical protein